MNLIKIKDLQGDLQLSIRSSKACQRLKVAKENGLSINRPMYKFKGIEKAACTILDRFSLPSTAAIVEWHTVEHDSMLESLFFDQTDYIFSLKLPPGSTQATLFSPIASLCDKSDWDQDNLLLTLPVNFGNDLGDFEFCWEWLDQNEIAQSFSFSGQVFSTKLDIYTHFKTMLHEVDQRFDWIRLDLLRQTSWGWENDTKSSADQNSWLAVFQDVRTKMESCFRKLIQQHRKRLVSQTTYKHPHKIRKVSAQREEKIFQRLHSFPHQKHAVTCKQFNSDTVENRYVKNVLLQSISQLERLKIELKKADTEHRFSQIFIDRITLWEQSWRSLSKQPFWRSIGRFKGLQKESLILSQDPLYAGIRRSHILLQHGLQLCDEGIKGGLQNVAQLYEAWCLLKLDQFITEHGEWKSTATVNMHELGSGASKFSYAHRENEDIQLHLLFQATAGKKVHKNGLWDGMLSLPEEQKPDLVLRLHRNDLPKKPVYTWIFDAKYRLHGQNAPADAINTMHRYRDAILWKEELEGTNRVSLVRESIGSYVLYPGVEATEQKNGINEKSSQISSVSQTNIGAFPLRPSHSADSPVQAHYLQNHLNTFLNISHQSDLAIKEVNQHYFTGVPEVKRALEKQRNIFVCCNITEDENVESFWAKCRNLCIGAKEISPTFKLNKWGYIVPSAVDGKPLGIFPIASMKKLSVDDAIKLHTKTNVISRISKISTEEECYLFKLLPPLPSMKKSQQIIITEL